MLTKGAKKYLANPILGVLPFAIFIILQSILPHQYSLITALVLTLASIVGLHKYFNNRIQGLTFYITAVSLVVMSLLWLFANTWIKNPYTYILIGEIALVIQLMLLRLGKTLLKARLFKDKSFMEKALLNDFFYTAAVLQYALTAHVFILLVYKQMTEGYINEKVDHILYAIIPLLIIIGLCVYQIFRTKYVVDKLRQEEWLPIVTEKGEVTGRIARTVSRNLKNKYMHPVVRIALICNKKIYLQQRDDKHMVDPGKLDHPFEKYMLFRHEVNQAAHNSIKRVLGRDVESEPDFIFKYVFENENTNRLVFLFAIKVDDESLVTKTQKMTGKFWTVKQIDEEFGDEIFSECFELEYEYLKHMILLGDADTLIAKENPCKCMNGECECMGSKTEGLA